MFEGLLPIGSVLLLTNSTKKVMVIGVCQRDSKSQVWDYAGVGYPEGYMGGGKTYLFNDTQIEKIFAVGYQDEEQFAFKINADAAIKAVREAEKAEQ